MMRLSPPSPAPARDTTQPQIATPLSKEAPVREVVATSHALVTSTPQQSPSASSVTPKPANSIERPSGLAGGDYLRHLAPQATAFRPPHELPSPFFANNTGVFRPAFPNSFQHPAHHHPPVLPHNPLTSQIQNGK